jgi:hypothetical protein
VGCGLIFYKKHKQIVNQNFLQTMYEFDCNWWGERPREPNNQFYSARGDARPTKLIHHQPGMILEYPRKQVYYGRNRRVVRMPENGG